MLIPLLIMAVAFKLFYIGSLFMRVRTELLKREQKSKWVKDLLAGN